MYIVFRLLCLPAGATCTNCFEIEISSQESSNINRYLVPLLRRFSITSKSTHWLNLRFFLYLTLKRLILLIKVKVFVYCWLKSTNFEPIEKRCIFLDLLGPTREIKSRSLLDINLFIASEKVEHYRLYLIR